MQQYRLIEAVGRPFDTALSAARMIYSGVFDKYPKLKVLFVHMGGALAPVVCRLDWNWELNYKGIQNPPIQKVDKNLRKPSEYFKSNIYVDTMGPSAIGLKAMIEMCGVDRVLFGTDFGPVPMSPKLHIDLVDDTIPDAGDRNKIFSTNTLSLFRLSQSRVSPESPNLYRPERHCKGARANMRTSRIETPMVVKDAQHDHRPAGSGGVAVSSSVALDGAER